MTKHFDTVDLLSLICVVAVTMFLAWGYHAFGVGY